MKTIKKVAVTPIEEKTGHIYDTTNIDNPNENTYSANIIDGLVGITKVTNISEILTVSEDFTILAPSIFKDRNRYFGSFIVKKNEGTFINSSENVATLNKTTLNVDNIGCFLSTDQWTTESVGYCYIDNRVIVKDGNSQNKYKFAKIIFNAITTN